MFVGFIVTVQLKKKNLQQLLTVHHVKEGTCSQIPLHHPDGVDQVCMASRGRQLEVKVIMLNIQNPIYIKTSTDNMCIYVKLS